MAATQKLVLTVPASKMAALLEVLRKFEAVKVERLEEIIARYIRNTPKNAGLTDDEIADILTEVRYGKPASAAQ